MHKWFVSYIRWIAFFFLSLCLSCTKTELRVLSEKQTALKQLMPEVSLIAHRGTSAWAPENTEAAMRLARNMGAHYLESDIQRTLDGYLVLFHDKTLLEKSNVRLLYPEEKLIQVKNFTLEELLELDFGEWFNNKNKQYARNSFENLDILTLEDLVKIAEGYRIKRNEQKKRVFHKENGRIVMEYEKDPDDNLNRPGVYLEIKYGDLYPHIEEDVKLELERLGWYADNVVDLKNIDVKEGAIGIANTPTRVVLQTFSVDVLRNLNQIFQGKMPLCFLLSAYGSVDKETYIQWINHAIDNNAVIIAPSIPSLEPYNFQNLLLPWMYDLIKESGLLIHPYVFQNEEQFAEYCSYSDGFMCDQLDEAIRFFSRIHPFTANGEIKNGNEWLDQLGY